MDLVQKEHDRLLKRLRSSQGINNVQATIDMLQSARDTIAAGQLITVVDIVGLGRGLAAGKFNSLISAFLCRPQPGSHSLDQTPESRQDIL
jgi:hypothetical protein